ncbi:tetratricopeptide repeat protein [Geodermatophilus sp. URMC 62]|uniref:tetratricopeptide repeat protein n=1 Tax=Geodermatophilus sp. URMC 62 TaxID=3423414 RepID=UPI00406D4429
MADLQRQDVRLDDALAILDEADALLQTAPVGERRAALLARTLIRRGDTRRLRADFASAEGDLLSALQLTRDPLDQVSAVNTLGVLLKDTGRLTEAEAQYTAALTALEAECGTSHPLSRRILHNLAGLAHARGRYTEGETFIRQALAPSHGPEHEHAADILSDRGVLGALLVGQGRLDEAETLFTELRAHWTTLRGPRHYEVAFCEHHLAVVREKRGDAPGALALYEDALRKKRDILGSEHPEVSELVRYVNRLLAVKTGPPNRRSSSP